MVIKYNRIVESCAMSKRPSQNGLSLTKDISENVIRIEGTNARTNTVTSYLSLEIPLEDLDKVINALVKLK